MKELQGIQTTLKTPKNNTNSFGGYKYRKASDILEAVKPILKQFNCSIVLCDSIELIGNRYFLKAVASIANDKGEEVCTQAFAELDNHKGMSLEQSTGAASSYARKYALCGLLAIDDSSVDPDTLKPIDKAAEALKYMEGNDKALTYYLAMYKHNDVTEFAKDELWDIATELINKKRIKL